MSFPRYPAYKDSGVDWLGKVPKHWGIQKFRHLFRESSEKITEVVVGKMLSVSGYRGIEIKEYDDDNRRRTDEDLVGYRIVLPGQLVVNTMWLNYAGLGVSDYEGHVSPAYRAYFIDETLDKRYIHHLMRSGIYVQGYTSLLTGIRPNSLQMSREDLMDFPIVSPPQHDQELIRAFLDRETAKIDALIAEQQRLIELLQEKRQAVISHAVTKGLNPDAPMKDSGVEWLGEVPEHWSAYKLGYAAKLQGGFAFSSDDFSSEGTPVVRMNNLRRGVLDLDDPVRIPDHSCIDKVALVAGDLVWGMSGSIGETGSLGNYARIREQDVPCQLNQRVGRFIANPSFLNLDFLEQVIRSSPFYEQVTLAVTGTAQFNISPEQVQAIMVAVPPLHEQSSIAAFIGEKADQFNALTAEAESSAELLQERRSALISAAVTGQIDVRGLVPVEEPP